MDARNRGGLLKSNTINDLSASKIGPLSGCSAAYRSRPWWKKVEEEEKSCWKEPKALVNSQNSSHVERRMILWEEDVKKWFELFAGCVVSSWVCSYYSCVTFTLIRFKRSCPEHWFWIWNLWLQFGSRQKIFWRVTFLWIGVIPPLALVTRHLPVTSHLSVSLGVIPPLIPAHFLSLRIQL